MAYPARIDWLLSSRALLEQSFDDNDIVNLWNKAMAKAADARIAGLSVGGAIESAYMAVLNACLALLAQQSLKTTSAKQHHENTFAGINAFAIPGLEELMPQSGRIRSLRTSATYDPDIATTSERGEALRFAKKTLPILHSTLVQWNPGIATRLHAP